MSWQDRMRRAQEKERELKSGQMIAENGSVYMVLGYGDKLPSGKRILWVVDRHGNKHQII